MITRIADRIAAFSLAAVVTLAMLGGIDGLARHQDDAAAQWAAKAAPGAKA